MMKATQKHSPALIAVAVITLALSAGCEKKTTTAVTTPAVTAPAVTAPETSTSTTTVTPTPGAERALNNAGDTLADAALTTKVKTALLADADVKGLRIDVDTRNSVVTLAGAVDNAGNMERAAALARGVEGVVSVDNRLTLAPR